MVGRHGVDSEFWNSSHRRRLPFKHTSFLDCSFAIVTEQKKNLRMPTSQPRRWGDAERMAPHQNCGAKTIQLKIYQLFSPIRHLDIIGIIPFVRHIITTGIRIPHLLGLCYILVASSGDYYYCHNRRRHHHHHHHHHHHLHHHHHHRNGNLPPIIEH